ncbi:unnamed protein product, partial [Rotaria sp. Silwood1]
TDEVITDTVIDNGALTEDENDHLNYSNEIVNELHQTKLTLLVSVDKLHLKPPSGCLVK